MSGSLVELVTAITALLEATFHVLRLVGTLAWPWLPLVVWTLFWLLIVDWSRLLPVLSRGGWLVVALLATAVLAIWMVVSPVPEGVEVWLGLKLDALVVRFVRLSLIAAAAIGAGAVQLSGLIGGTGTPRRAMTDFQSTSAETVVQRIPNV
jgi:hypothetical protein